MGKKGYCCSLLDKLLMRNNFQIKFLSLTEKSEKQRLQMLKGNRKSVP